MKRTFCVLCAMLLLALPIAGPADSLTLPDGLTAIEDGAFAGDTSLDTLIAPAGLASVGAGAFSGCSSLDIVELPGDSTAIGADAFSGCGSALLIRAPYGSPAHLYARQNSIDYQAGTRYRALLIANSYPGTDSELIGPPYDAANMRACLTGLPGVDWEVTTRTNLTADGITSAIAAAFSGATDADVSMVYYSGHGSYLSGWGACLVGTDYYGCFASDLREVLDGIPGRKIIIVDACYSGGLISGFASDDVTTADAAEEEAQAGVNPGAFVSGLISPFAMRRRGASDGSYYIMAACAADEESWELTDGSNHYGAFTCCLLTGIGYSVPSYAWITPPADINGDEALSFSEAFSYARSNTMELMTSLGETQTAACYPAGVTWFAPFRYR